MRCLVLVKFLPGGSIAPGEFFARINAQWGCLEERRDSESQQADFKKIAQAQSPRSAICIAEYESIEQLSLDLSIMPGAGIFNVEVLPVIEESETSKRII